jgi:hypothetical protein
MNSALEVSSCLSEACSSLQILTNDRGMLVCCSVHPACVLAAMSCGQRFRHRTGSKKQKGRRKQQIQEHPDQSIIIRSHQNTCYLLDFILLSLVYLFFSLPFDTRGPDDFVRQTAGGTAQKYGPGPHYQAAMSSAASPYSYLISPFRNRLISPPREAETIPNIPMYQQLPGSEQRRKNTRRVKTASVSLSLRRGNPRSPGESPAAGRSPRRRKPAKRRVLRAGSAPPSRIQYGFPYSEIPPISSPFSRFDPI